MSPAKRFALSACLAFLAAAYARAAEQPASLTLRFDGETRSYSPAELLARSDAATIGIPLDSSYGKPMTYRAVPLRGLLAGLPLHGADAVQAAAHDGFVAEIPASLLTAAGGAVPWVAIDDPANQWPNLPGKTANAGPFYLVWEHPERSRIRSEQWVTELDSVTGVQAPEKRWPQLVVSASASAQVRHGMSVYVTQCLPCHQLYGAGSGTMGPDLGRPMNVTAYMTAAGLKALVRNPRGVRFWPAMQMGGFTTKALPDDDLDAIVAYLQYKAAHAVASTSVSSK
jgi:mono/diheme cytochrome c family protein